MRIQSTLIILGLVATILPSVAAPIDLSKLPPASDKTGVTYAKDIRPLFEATCFRCHGEERPRGGLRLDSLESVLKGGEDGKVILPGKSKESPLLVAVAQLDPETAMPPKRGGGRGGPGGGGGRGGFGPGMILAPQMVSQGDKDGDMKLSKTEFTALADAWFDKLDADKAGQLGREQFTAKLGDILPAPQGRPGRPPGDGQPGGGQGPGDGRGGFNPGRMVGPGLFTAADADKDGSLTRAEWKAIFAKWFGEWDSGKNGALAEDNIRAGLTAALPMPNFGGRGGPGGQGGGGQSGRGGPGGSGPRAAPLTPEQVGLVRAWIEQGAK